jgi:hypothetical protein
VKEKATTSRKQHHDRDGQDLDEQYLAVRRFTARANCLGRGEQHVNEFTGLLGLRTYEEVSIKSCHKDGFAILADEGIPAQVLSCGQGMPICCPNALVLEAHVDDCLGRFVNHKRVNAAHNPNS